MLAMELCVTRCTVDHNEPSVLVACFPTTRSTMRRMAGFFNRADAPSMAMAVMTKLLRNMLVE